MTSTNKPIDTNTFIDQVTNQSTVALAKPDGDGDKSKEMAKHRKELKKHHKMLMEKAEEHYEKGDKEMGKKYMGHARKLAEDMEDETKELKMADYDIDEAAMGSEKVKALSKAIEDLTVQLSNAQNEIATIKLGRPSQSKDEVLAEVEAAMAKYKSLIEGAK